jgi:hypothetical protein
MKRWLPFHKIPEMLSLMTWFQGSKGSLSWKQKQVDTFPQ